MPYDAEDFRDRAEIEKREGFSKIALLIAFAIGLFLGTMAALI